MYWSVKGDTLKRLARCVVCVCVCITNSLELLHQVPSGLDTRFSQSLDLRRILNRPRVCSGPVYMQKTGAVLLQNSMLSAFSVPATMLMMWGCVGSTP